ncbi:MAG: hypothetical protein GAK35_03762 [Herbaspirillum frisingense]|uniref:Carboxypeptidase regulatory-like domain-containing protein n=1 Tax=Herbaspirillum frisingense TaxID=92645 RepID=A0A7V8FTP3_9BURK|nr:MAG: hypothetical protein GAK35_03762 [Herbaspirillum frisingense]
MQLRFTSFTVTSSWRDLHPQECAHAGRTKKLASCLLALSLAAGAAPLVLAQTGAAPYMNGGIGGGEQDKIKAAAKDYNLHLLFSQNNGEYISDVKLEISDAKGATVFTLPSAGPMTNVQLPAGKYKVKATYKEETRSQDVSVMGGKASNLSFRWGGADK